jgi:hypothetical protein
MVGGDKDGKLLYMEPSLLSRNQNPTSSNNRKNIIEEKFVVLTSNQKPVTTISPLIIERQLTIVPER